VDEGINRSPDEDVVMPALDTWSAGMAGSVCRSERGGESKKEKE
jgi:hypothetical protein